MKSFYHFLGDALHQRPSAAADRLGPWIIAILGTVVLALVAHAWWTAPALP